MDPVPARHAATVILARDGVAGVEVLLMQRPAKASFFGGAYVFPGGAVDRDDHGPAMRGHLGAEGEAAGARLIGQGSGAPADPDVAVGLMVAACREVFEECGVLLAVGPDGSPWRSGGAAGDGAVADLRARLHAEEIDFAGVLAALGARLDPGALRLWAHWITPSVERKRFDTRFFVARMPPGQRVVIDAREAVDHRWGSPGDLLAACEAGDIALPPPTFRNLEELGVCAGADLSGLWRALADRPVVPIQPKIGSVGGAIAILLPWDPLYRSSEGEGVGAAVRYPPSYTEGPSRVVLEQGRWVSRRG